MDDPNGAIGATAVKTQDKKIQRLRPKLQDLKDAEVKQEAASQGLFFMSPTDAAEAGTIRSDTMIPTHPLEKVLPNQLRRN
mmetsp:Transcript_20598/g.46724  ORF Transcript_20598/g.46724 Transcript_20598/m.46724 type:complete len:81 (-) Transcript_20598:93-335(-)|eukprot:CAMPEP_0113312278 /NCGR_PEP_ID=MMETSP0010_2-20120614/9169_1 /TAXON_ID=216773 ORGANISM="Corethron hystrix, Strain 308" /NCGR_SAMPLE_ID=MMETSP0010_2 /ASSEMBLY_ACC=CAM_ASM_000155 /LENGTH=80 /DNA_ID=CAMNT_0000168065 /DNA_START=1010 /DNA_END=1252 /DNA_ORIENTATION=+ /assembly_acc=CAM_ASM_000155